MNANPEGGAVVIVEYDPRWPLRFGEEARLLAAIGPRVVAVEHVGSTAVPGLADKPIVDILVGVRRLEDAVACVAPLAAIGYEYVPEYEAEIPDRRYFRKAPFGERTHHLHVVEFGGAFWRRHLAFRDWLRTHPEDAARYGAHKRALAATHVVDREAFTEAKTAFVREIEAKALASERNDILM